MTCTAMSGFGKVATGLGAFYAVVPGLIRLRNCVRPAATGNDRPAASVPSASALRERFSLPRYHPLEVPLAE